MAGGFAVGKQWNVIQTTTPSSSAGISVAGSASTNTAGAYTQLIASTTRDSTWAMALIQDQTSGSVVGAASLNLATGAASSEVVQIQNLVVSHGGASGIKGQIADFLFPWVVPAGTRISASCQSSQASPTVVVSLTLFDDAFASATGGGGIDTIGFNTATTAGTLIDPGATANTKGAYAQITASTAADYAGFFLGLDGNVSGSISTTDVWISLDVAIGGSGSEVIILPDYQCAIANAAAPLRYLAPASSPMFHIPIPAGSRIAVRAEASSATSPLREFNVTFYGVRQ